MKQITYGLGGFDPSKPNNNIVEEIEIDVPQVPLQGAAVLATLLATLGVIGLQDAANAVSMPETDLIAEAQAWAAAMVDGADDPR